MKEDTPAEQLERHDSIVATLESYTERSRSGLGRHIWVRGEIGKGCRRDGVELYSQERLIICTGDVTHDLPIAERQQLISNMASRMRPPALPDADLRPDTDDDDMGCCVAAAAIEDAGEMGRLMRGDWQGRQYPSQSEADFALMLMLARCTESNNACREAFRLSTLSRRLDKPNNYTDARLNVILSKVRSIVADEASHITEGARIAGDLFWPEPTWPLPGVPPRRLRLLLDGDLDALPPLDWLVKGIMPNAGIGAFFGPSGSYKSFLTLDALAHISNGKDWFGHRVKAAPAVYVPFEGQGGIPKRIRAWRLAQTAVRHSENLATFEPDNDVVSNIAVIMEPLSLREQADRDELVSLLKESGWAGGVLCIDTLAHASAGIEENSSAMGEMIGIFRDLQQRLGGVILLVHHSGKDETRGMRGWSGLHAAMDFAIECQKKGEPETREAAFSLAKVKDGTTGTSFKFRMQLVPLGSDEDGDPITSLTVCPAEPIEKTDHPFKTSKAGIRDIDADTSAQDDTFVYNWICDLVVNDVYPSDNSLKGQLPAMKETGYSITQDRVTAAVERMLADEKLAVEREVKSPNGNVWIRPDSFHPVFRKFDHDSPEIGGSLALGGFVGGSLGGD